MSIENGWFYEKNSQWPGQAMGLEIKEMLLEEKTKYQDLKVFESMTWGKVLVLDGVIQLTEKDEMSYQEMLAHIPMYSHAKPKRVLIVGYVIKMVTSRKEYDEEEDEKDGHENGAFEEEGSDAGELQNDEFKSNDNEKSENFDGEQKMVEFKVKE